MERNHSPYQHELRDSLMGNKGQVDHTRNILDALVQVTACVFARKCTSSTILSMHCNESPHVVDMRLKYTPLCS